MVKEEINEILNTNTAREKQETLMKLMPELKFMKGFDHKHPHHHLDVWEHTMLVLDDLKDQCLDVKMAGLLHDVGKPFSFQDEEVRHFHGHPEASKKISINILERLGYDAGFIRSVAYLVETHDTIIDPKKLDAPLSVVKKRLKLQYADAKAHHPDKIEKRIKFLNDIENNLPEEKVIERGEIEL